MPRTTLPARMARAVGSKAASVLRMRWLMRAPIWIYRARLGAIFGQRMLMLEHVGRKSGAQRYVVLEVIDHPAPGTYIIASGFGTRAQWYRNVRANPAVRVYIAGHKPAPANARLLTPEETKSTLDTYATRYPRRWDTFSSLLETTLGTTTGEHYTELPMIALDLSGG